MFDQEPYPSSLNPTLNQRRDQVTPAITQISARIGHARLNRVLRVARPKMRYRVSWDIRRFDASRPER
jgi:hypothetical protein